MNYTIEELSELFPGSVWKKTTTGVLYIDGKDFEIQWRENQFICFEPYDEFHLTKKMGCSLLEEAQRFYKQYTKLKNFK